VNDARAFFFRRAGLSRATLFGESMYHNIRITTSPFAGTRIPREKATPSPRIDDASRRAAGAKPIS